MPDKTTETQPESEFDLQNDESKPDYPPAPEGLPESAHVQDDRGVEAVYAVGEGPVLGVDPPGHSTVLEGVQRPPTDEETNEQRAARYSARGVWKGEKPPPSSFPVTEQETMDGSRAIVHLFQEIPGDTELKRHLLYGTIQFQHGPIAEVGVNGGTIEGVITVLKERLEGFQQGPFACSENATAILGLQQVLNVLGLRTRRRREQGVEGTNAPHQEV